MTARTLIVGLGSPHGDDAAGWRVVEELQSAASPSIEIRPASDPTDVLLWISGVSQLHICDACQTGDEPGAIHSWQWPEGIPVSSRSDLSSHGLKLPEVLQLADRLGMLPARVMIWGIEIESVRPGQGLSRPVSQAATSLAGLIAREFQDA